jgi:hypothetical protein
LNWIDVNDYLPEVEDYKANLEDGSEVMKTI